MRPGGGKEKGSQFERDMGAAISLWLSHGEKKDLLCRTVGSGGQYTFAATRGTVAGIPGDLRSQSPLADGFCNEFVMECKHWKNLNIHQFLEKQGELYDALQKVAKEGEKERKSWWLIAKQNHKKTLLFMPVQAMSTAYASGIVKLDFHILFSGTVYMYYLAEYLSSVQPEQLFNSNIPVSTEINVSN